MAKKRANGEGNIRKRKDGRLEGRYTAGHDPETGKAIYKNVLGRTQAETKSKLKAAIEETKSLDVTKAGKYTVGTWTVSYTHLIAASGIAAASSQQRQRHTQCQNQRKQFFCILSHDPSS